MQRKSTAYVRVSTKSAAQFHSFEFQEDYWRRAIDKKPNHIFVGIYADKGISGKSLNNRKQFKAMVAAAKRGEIDTIFTKAVSRFGRNAEDIMRTVKELRELGVNVIFEDENINTKTASSDLYLTVAAAIAQDNLRTNADNMRWTMRRKFEEGQIVIGSGIYGYRLKEGDLMIEESEADIVRLIFYLYLNGMGKQGIANMLTRRGAVNYHGNTHWSANTVSNMLRNEKYCGDMLLQKTVVIDGKTYINNGHADQFYVDYSHEGIISRDDFARAQEISLERRSSIPLPQPEQEYAFRSKIECGICGKNYTHKINNAGSKYAKPMWACTTYLKNGKCDCPSRSIFNYVLEAAFIEAYNEFVKTKGQYVANESAVQEKSKLLDDERKLKALAVKKLISDTEYAREQAHILSRIRDIEAEIKRQAFNDVGAKNAKPIIEFSSEAVTIFLSRAVVINHTVTFEFVNGCTITKPYSNGRGGNKKGWTENAACRQEGRLAQ